MNLLQILLHFCMFYIGLVLVLASKRCLPLIPDGTKMLLSFIANSYSCSDNFSTLPVYNYIWGGYKKHFGPLKY